jgi:hypothetical protein
VRDIPSAERLSGECRAALTQYTTYSKHARSAKKRRTTGGKSMSDFESAKRSAKKNDRLQKVFILIIGWALVLAMLSVTVTVISTAGLKQPVANVLALIAGLSIGYSVRRVVNYYGDKMDQKLGVVER